MEEYIWFVKDYRLLVASPPEMKENLQPYLEPISRPVDFFQHVAGGVPVEKVQGCGAVIIGFFDIDGR